MDILASIQNYFRDWLKSTGGIGAYTTFYIDLSVAHTDKRYTFSGDQIIITDCDNSAYIKLNDVRNDSIDVSVVRQIHTPFNELYVTNAASAGTLKILVGSDGIFSCNQTQPVDITRCNIGNLPIDIKANTIGNLPIDIKANTLGNIPIDIKALTIGNLDVDLNAQSIGDLDINLNAQNVSRLIIRDHDGGIESSSVGSGGIAPAAEGTLHSYNGSGCLRYVTFASTIHTDSHLLTPRIYIDGTKMVPDLAFSSMNVQGYNSNTRPLMLTRYAVDDWCWCIYYFEKGITFDTSISIRAHNPSATQTLSATAYWFYQALT